MAIHELKEQIGRLPEQPGVYLYFNAEGDAEPDDRAKREHAHGADDACERPPSAGAPRLSISRRRVA